jgi:hypothetical protein
MLNLPSDETMGIGLECPQTCTGAEIDYLPAIESAGILVLITDLASTSCL